MYNQRARPPVIADVARLAGVSVPTVSRVLTGSTPVRDDTRARVLDAIRVLDYRPNASARALVRGRQSIVGVITSNTTRFGYASTIQGVEEAGRNAGLLVAITVIDSDGESAVRAAIDLLVGQALAGVIVLDFDRPGYEALQALPGSVPVVAVGVPRAAGGREVSRVLLDEYHGGLDATRHLLGLGHATVHHVSIPGSGGRSVGWRDALVAANARVPDIVEADWSPRSGYEAGMKLAGLGDVTAVLCGNDEIAFGVAKALQASGLRVPDDVSIVGFDDVPTAEFWTPSLTTIRQDFVSMGSSALAALLEEIAGRSPAASTARRPELVIRESTAPPRR